MIVKLILLLFLIVHTLFSANLKPTHSYKGTGSITDILQISNLLYAASNQGVIDIFDLNTNKLKSQIILPTIKDFMNDDIKAKIFSIDLYNDKLLIVAQGTAGFRNVFIHKDNKLTPIITHKNKLFISKAKYISDNEIIFALLSNEVALYNFTQNKIIWQKQINTSRFSDFQLNNAKSKLALTDESGEIFLVDVQSGDTLEKFVGQNVDNIFQVDYKNGIITGAGQDRRVSVYDSHNKSNTSYKKSSFIVYSVGLSPSAKLTAYSSNEENDIIVMKTDSKTVLHTLLGHKSIISKILFINEDEIFTSSDDQYINYWKLK